MGRRLEGKAGPMRPEWVYVGAAEAAVLGGVSNRRIQAWIASGELVAVRLDGERCSGRPRNLYRLDLVLALARKVRR